MPNDKDLEQTVQTYQSLAKNNPNIDVGSLMLNALQTGNQNRISAKTKKWAYLISVAVPPFGLLFALKFYFGEEEDAKATALSCVILTILSLAAFWAIGKLFFSSTGVSVNQIQQIKPQDIMQLTQ